MRETTTGVGSICEDFRAEKKEAIQSFETLGAKADKMEFSRNRWRIIWKSIKQRFGGAIKTPVRKQNRSSQNWSHCKVPLLKVERIVCFEATGDSGNFGKV